MGKKNLLLMNSIILILIALLLSCKKSPNDIQPQDITGYWRWISTYYDGPLSPTNPETPQNTGKEEILVFLRNHSWYKSVNHNKTDSGEYYLGHIMRLLDGKYIFTYDSISYYRNGSLVEGGVDYYRIYGDSLHFMPYYGGRFRSYTLPFNGGKYWIRE
jgi:hypothetical protein